MVDHHLGRQCEHRVRPQLRIGEQVAVDQVPRLVEQHELDAVQPDGHEELGVEQQQTRAVTGRDDRGGVDHRGRDLVSTLGVEPRTHDRLGQPEVEQRRILELLRLLDHQGRGWTPAHQGLPIGQVDERQSLLIAHVPFCNVSVDGS